MAMNRGTEAYDLSLFEERPAKIVKLKTNKKMQKAEQRKNAIQSLLDTAAIVCVAALVVSVVGMMIASRVRLTEMDNQINTLEEKLVVLQSEKIRLTDELARKTSAKSVEEYAYNELGMQKTEAYQIEYIPAESGDKAVVAQRSETSVLAAVGKGIAKFFMQLAYLFE